MTSSPFPDHVIYYWPLTRLRLARVAGSSRHQSWTRGRRTHTPPSPGNITEMHGTASSQQAASLCPLFSPENIWSGHPRDTFAKCSGTFYVNKQCKFTLCLCKICSSNDIDGLSKTIQDSSVYPILVKPWTVNKVTCGSLLTFLDAATPDVTVSFDACLVALILLNLFIFGPLLWADVGDKFSNIFFSFQDRIDRIENAMGLENHFDAYKNPTFLENIISTIHNNTYLGRYFTLLQF